MMLPAVSSTVEIKSLSDCSSTFNFLISSLLPASSTNIC